MAKDTGINWTDSTFNPWVGCTKISPACDDSFYPNHENVCLGITVCNQEEANRDIPKLLKIPAAKRFLSIEPMLGEIDLTEIVPAVMHKYNSLTGLIEYIGDGSTKKQGRLIG